MRPLLAIALACLSCCTGVAHAQHFSATFGYGAPLVVGYGYPGIGYPYAGYPYAGYPYSGYAIGYGYTWPYYLDSPTGYLGPYIAPPLYVPPEQLGFGPQAVRQFMGLDRVQRPIVNQNIIVAPQAADANLDQRAMPANQVDNAARLRVRQSNAEARDRAQQFLQFGDEQFASRNLAGAYDRYKKAGEAAPDLAEPHFRQGHTLADLGRYQQAAAAFRRGLALSPNWPSRGFNLAELYAENGAARHAAFDALLRAAAANPDEQDVQFVAGVQLFFDGRREDATKYFERAKSLGEPTVHVNAFLPQEDGPEAAELDI